MLKIVHSKKRLSPDIVSDPYPSREVVEWTLDFLSDLDDLIEGHLQSPSCDEFPGGEADTKS